MVEPLVEPYDKLSVEEIMELPQDERSRFYESSILTLINANGNRGLSTTEIERSTGYPKNSLLKTVEMLFHKRKIHRISRGKFSVYYPIGMESSNNFRDIMYGQNQIRRYGIKVIQNIEGKFVQIQEREIDENGFLNDIGGVLIPLVKVPELINMLKLVIDESGNLIMKEKR